MLPDYQWLNQYEPARLGLRIHIHGQVADPDGQLVTVTMTSDASGETLFAGRPAERVEVGTYEITLSSDETDTPGTYTLRWDYTADGEAAFIDTSVEVGEYSPTYAGLAPGMRDIIEMTWARFEDTFDSPTGGPNVQVYFQTHFSRERMTTLLRIAVGRLNTVAQPFQTFTIDGDGGSKFPIDKWGALLEKALYVETLKHLRRSYVEQPLLMGGEVTRQDRRDYLDRWGMVLADEEADLKNQLDTFKIRSMGLGRPAVLVSGGVYGRSPSGIMYAGRRGRPRFYHVAMY